MVGTKDEPLTTEIDVNAVPVRVSRSHAISGDPTDCGEFS